MIIFVVKNVNIIRYKLKIIFWIGKWLLKIAI